MSEKTSLRPNQKRAINALARGASFDNAANAAGVSVRTLHRWRNEADFIAALRTADDDHLRDLTRKLNAAADLAFSVLVEVASDKNAPRHARLRAADSLLKHRVAFMELVTISDQIAAMREQIEELKREGRPKQIAA